MSVWTRVLLGLAVGAIAGYVTGKWGSRGGLAAMVAGMVSVGLLPLAVDWINKRKASEPPDRIQDE